MEAQHEAMDRNWSDVLITEGDEPVVVYRTGMVVYEESLTLGRYVGRAWNGSGYVSYYDGRMDPAVHPMPQAFWLEVDGQLLASDWEWQGAQVAETPRGKQVTVSLRHTVRPVSLKVCTLLDGTPVLTRRLEITNTGDRPAALAACGSWSGVLQTVRRRRDVLPPEAGPLFSLGYAENPHWGHEGSFQWHDLPAAGYRVDGRYRRDRHRHPWFALRNNATGEMFVGQLAWSGGYSFEFDLSADTSDADARLFFRAGPDAPAPQRVLAPGETVTSPEMHLGLTFGDLDNGVQAMHDHLRRSVMKPQARGRGGWVESGIGPEIEITHDEVLHAIDCAAEMGCEVFFIDASWYAPPRSNWWSTVGEWSVDLTRFPEGLEPFRRRAHDQGMLFGLWMDAERIGSESGAAKQHPDWEAAAYDGRRSFGGQLDLTNPEVADWVEAQIARVIEENQLEFFRLDYNVGGMGMGARTLRDGFVENGFWRYYQALYSMYDRLRERFPDVIFESCAGGGGRTDVGMVSRFSHSWVTDWQIAPRSFAITNGMTMALPPEFVDRLIGGQSGYLAADFDFQARQLLFVRPTIGFPKPRGAQWNPQMLARMKRWIGLYKGFVRPFMATGRIYHHTPEVPDPEPRGWGVLELDAADGLRGICGLFRLAGQAPPEYLLRLRGIDRSRRYRVTFDNSGQVCEVDGMQLATQGLTVRLDGALTSELLVYEAAG